MGAGCSFQTTAPKKTKVQCFTCRDRYYGAKEIYLVKLLDRRQKRRSLPPLVDRAYMSADEELSPNFGRGYTRSQILRKKMRYHYERALKYKPKIKHPQGRAHSRSEYLDTYRYEMRLARKYFRLYQNSRIAR